jgi:hypothetical protein
VVIHERRAAYVHTVPLPAGPVPTEFEVAASAFDAALTFVRSAYRQLPLVPPLPLYLCGRFAAVPDLEARAGARFPIPLEACPAPPRTPHDFQPAAFASALGMLSRPAGLRPRLTLQQVGIGRVA